MRVGQPHLLASATQGLVRGRAHGTLNLSLNSGWEWAMRTERQRAAVEAERDAWAEVKNSMPGCPTHNPQKWKAWAAAVRAVTEHFRASERPDAADPRLRGARSAPRDASDPGRRE